MNNNKTGFTCSTFDLFHAGHIDMLQQAKQVCDYLIVGLQTDPTIDRSFKNRPIQSIVERQLQLKATKLVDEIYVYETEKDLEDLLNILQIDVRIIGEEYRGMPFTGKDICLERGIEVWYNRRRHTFSSSELRQRVKSAELMKTSEISITEDSTYPWNYDGMDTTYNLMSSDLSVETFNNDNKE